MKLGLALLRAVVGALFVGHGTQKLCALLALGLCTPLAAAMLSGTMITAVRTAHLPKGPWNSDGGYEYNLVLIGLLFALTDVGPGDWSMDAARGRTLSGPGWALAELGAAAAGSAGVIAAGRNAT